MIYRYKPYYKMAAALRLPIDPRRVHYGSIGAGLTIALGSLLTTWISTIVICFSAGPEAHVPGGALNPVGILFVEVTTRLFESASPLLNAARSAGEITMFILAAATLVIAYRMAWVVAEHAEFYTNEKGISDYASPEEIQAIAERDGIGILPRGYDVNTGFSQEVRTRQRELRRHSRILIDDRTIEAARTLEREQAERLRLELAKPPSETQNTTPQLPGSQ